MAVAPPSSLPRAPGWRDRLRARRARRLGVEVGEDVVLGRGVRFGLAPGGRVALGDGCVVGDGCRFHVSDGEVVLGPGCVLGDRCAVVAHERVELGAACMLGDEVVLVDHGHRFDDVDTPVRLQGLRTAAVVVGDGVRIGPGAVVEPGVRIGHRAQVGAHVVVERDVAAGEQRLAAERPAPVTRPRA